MIEFYTLKFHYRNDGSMHIHVGWGGQAHLSSVHTCSFAKPLREFLKTRPPINCTNYTHLFLFSTDGTPWDTRQQSGLGLRLNEALLILQNRAGAQVCKIGMIACMSQKSIPNKEAEAKPATKMIRSQRRLFPEEGQYDAAKASSDHNNERSKQAQLRSDLADLPDVPEWLQNILPTPQSGFQLDMRAIQARYNCTLVSLALMFAYSHVYQVQ
ncbi:hypothetical protein BD289DRAFT_127152 [Coniella lustricola]|uniref:Uncharacterized protein n=1 Tax=Coniella lustricola TaxID=2025994 RepID=A0A2T2ZWC1_9PEZI|nr:hypothetical protein BD289DRAFT_127152 [Coniella lustricola]